MASPVCQIYHWAHMAQWSPHFFAHGEFLPFSSIQNSVFFVALHFDEQHFWQDYGNLFCIGENLVGGMSEPCSYQILPTGNHLSCSVRAYASQLCWQLVHWTRALSECFISWSEPILFYTLLWLIKRLSQIQYLPFYIYIIQIYSC